MSTILVNNVKSYTGSTVTISGSNIAVQGHTTLGDSVGDDKITVNGNITASNNISASGDIIAANLTLSGNATITGNTTINGNLTFGDSTSDSVNFGAEISSSIIPDADDTYDLGSSAKQWKDLYIDGTANIDTLAGVATATFIDATVQGTATISSASIDFVSSSIIPYTDNTYDLGSSVREWKDLYVDGTANIDTANIDNLVTSQISSSIDVSGSILPHTGGVFALGTMAKSWGSLHVHGLAHIHTASIGITYSSLIPAADNTYDLGSSVREWKDLYVDGTANIDNIGNGVSIPSISSSINVSGSITAHSITLDQDIKSAAATDAAFYTINGKRVEVRSQLQAAPLGSGSFFLELRNTSVNANSLVVGSLIGNTVGSLLTGSVLSCNVLGNNTASLNFKVMGAPPVDNSTFTASIAIF